MSSSSELKEENIAIEIAVHPHTYVDICRAADMEVVLEASDAKATAFSLHYRVSSQQLCAGSPVFSAMLGPNSSFREATQLRASKIRPQSSENLYQLKVSNHDPAALAAVFHILHATTTCLPDSIPFDGLVELAIVCDYYDCAAVVQPWADRWMDQWKPSTENPGYEAWLFVAWVFGNASICKALARKFLRQGIIKDGDFKIMAHDDPPLIQELPRGIPDSIRDALFEERRKLGEKLVTKYLEVHDRFESSTVLQCSHSRPTVRCDHFIFGQLHRELKAAQLLADTQCLTPEHIVNKVTQIFNNIYLNLDGPVRFHSDDHDECLDFRYGLCRGMKSILDEAEPLGLISFDGGRKPVVKKQWQELVAGGQNGE